MADNRTVMNKSANRSIRNKTEIESLVPVFSYLQGRAIHWNVHLRSVNNWVSSLCFQKTCNHGIASPKGPHTKALLHKRKYTKDYNKMKNTHWNECCSASICSDILFKNIFNIKRNMYILICHNPCMNIFMKHNDVCVRCALPYIWQK